MSGKEVKARASFGIGRRKPVFWEAALQGTNHTRAKRREECQMVSRVVIDWLLAKGFNVCGHGVTQERFILAMLCDSGAHQLTRAGLAG